ncbi:hypothetical protein [Kribbella sp. C-35]|uniref:hypothetical protein n=1 Tax=Kribbella sp. C-35 TaxID=2789276 RepID=UPI003978EB94
MVQRERDPNHPLAGPNGAVAVLVGIVIVIAAIVWGALRLGTAWAGTTTYVTTNPVGLLVGGDTVA